VPTDIATKKRLFVSYGLTSPKTVLEQEAGKDIFTGLWLRRRRGQGLV